MNDPFEFPEYSIEDEIEFGAIKHSPRLGTCFSCGDGIYLWAQDACTPDERGISWLWTEECTRSVDEIAEHDPSRTESTRRRLPR